MKISSFYQGNTTQVTARPIQHLQLLVDTAANPRKWYLDWEGKRYSIPLINLWGNFSDRHNATNPGSQVYYYVLDVMEIHYFDGKSWNIVDPMALVAMQTGGDDDLTYVPMT
jgi:hypothetical protein